MTDFLDIAEETRSVTISGAEVPVTGLPAADIATLFRRFPEVQQVLSGEAAEVEPARLAEIGPQALAAIGAVGLGHSGNKQAEAKFGRLAFHLQVKIVRDVIDMTWPGVLDPLVRKFERIAAAYLAAIETGSDETEGNRTRSKSSRRRSKN